MISRKQKIDFLNGLLEGNRKIEELKPSKKYILRQDPKEADTYYFRDPSIGKHERRMHINELATLKFKYSSNRFQSDILLIVSKDFETFPKEVLAQKAWQIFVRDIETAEGLINLK